MAVPQNSPSPLRTWGQSPSFSYMHICTPQNTSYDNTNGPPWYPNASCLQPRTVGAQTTLGFDGESGRALPFSGNRPADRQNQHNPALPCAGAKEVRVWGSQHLPRELVLCEGLLRRETRETGASIYLWGDLTSSFEVLRPESTC